VTKKKMVMLHGHWKQHENKWSRHYSRERQESDARTNAKGASEKSRFVVLHSLPNMSLDEMHENVACTEGKKFIQN
jgi:hypothetical protein